MTTRTLSADLFGRKVEFEYSERGIGYAITIARVAMGWIFTQAGLDKILDPEWTAAGFLQFAIPEGNPFASLWAGMVGSPLVDNLVQWGLFLIGVSLILGFFVRWAALWGAVMMVLFWMASLQGGLGQFLPLEHGWVIDDHLIYAALLYFLGAVGAGRILGLDAVIERSDFVKNNSWVKFFTG
ncbi:MAG: DoxX family protein [Pirellulales bacterium]|nr:DoxX family protein [Pirellulales bacterium]